jgi:prepilin-type N-terminal cleavage/methylation domain-containing protein/prepilin-type processing-associated H-X9-DG protein
MNRRPRTSRPPQPSRHRDAAVLRRGFTLIELLVVIAIVALLLSMLMPSLSHARSAARTAVCGSNIRQLVLANHYYEADYRGVYCPGAMDSLRNLHRWHGVREAVAVPFTPTGGPFSPYLGADGAVQQCSVFELPEGGAAGPAAFERGSGGYGYNNAFLGMQLREAGDGAYVFVTDKAGAHAARVRNPSATVMFADAAFAGAGLIAYSFAEPRFHPSAPGFRMDPSVHFRHRGAASIAWSDGHVDTQRRTFTWQSGFYPGDPQPLGIGWFGAADDNSLFDLR